MERQYFCMSVSSSALMTHIASSSQLIIPNVLITTMTVSVNIDIQKSGPKSMRLFVSAAGFQTIITS